MGVGRGVSPPEGCDGLRAHVSLSPLRPSLTLGKVDVRVRQGEYGTIPTAGDGRRHCRWVKEEKTFHPYSSQLFPLGAVFIPSAMRTP